MMTILIIPDDDDDDSDCSSLLPPKKLIGSKEPAFIMKRRRELEAYLQVGNAGIIIIIIIIRWLSCSKSFSVRRQFVISWSETFPLTSPPSLALDRSASYSIRTLTKV